MTVNWLNRLLIVLTFFIVASVANAQDKRPPVPPAPPSGPATTAKPELPSGVPAGRPAATSSGTNAAPAGTNSAGATAALPAPKPAPELDQLKFLLGKWRCDGKQFAGPMSGPEHMFKAVAESKADLDGFWNQFMYEEKTSKDHRGFKVHGLWGWDQGAKRLIRAAASSGGNWDSATAPGLEGDKIVWTGDFSGSQGHMAFRQTFTKKTEKEWGYVLEIKDPTGKWMPTEEVSCKR